MAEVIFEHIVEGAIVRVAAVDVETGVEVVILGPVNASRWDLERIALLKLNRAIARAAEPAHEPAPHARRRGQVV